MVHLYYPLRLSNYSRYYEIGRQDRSGPPWCDTADLPSKPMATTTTTPTDNKVSTPLEFRGLELRYFGRDTYGNFHYYDSSADRVVVTESDAEIQRPSDDYVVHHILEDVIHVQPLGDREPDAWVAFIQEDRGWAERPPMAQAIEVVEAQL